MGLFLLEYNLLKKAMQIDRNNFEQHLDLILKEIQESHFVSFDCEFTGLVTQTQHLEGLFPDHREFYERIKETALNFNLLQLGITVFLFQEGQYYPKSYNFYVSGANRVGFNKVIVSEWQSLAFLARNGMDFSHAFKFGIEYTRLHKQEQKVELCNPLQQRLYGAQTIFFNPADKELIAAIEKAFASEQRLRVDFKSKRIFDYFRNNYDMSFDKPKKNMERYEYEVKIYKKDEIIFQKDEIIFQKEVKEEVNQLCQIQQVNLEQQKAKHPRTLQVVIEKIISCAKPIVGHFLNLDIGLIYHSFINDLPPTFQQFTDSINGLFPYIFDTKIISRRLQSRLKSIKVDLKSLYKACWNKKLLQPYANINYKYVQGYVQSDSSHEAGYDSFMTGCAFIGMLNYLHEHKQGPFVFANANADNKILYSKFSGQVSLVGPYFCYQSEEYKQKIVILGKSKKEHDFKAIGESLSKVGTLSVYEDHGQTYYVFDENQDIELILGEFKELKRYEERRIIKSRNMFV